MSTAPMSNPPIYKPHSDEIHSLPPTGETPGNLGMSNPPSSTNVHSESQPVGPAYSVPENPYP